MKILTHWLISTIAVILSAYILQGVHVAGFFSALVFSLVIGIINVFLRPILVLLTLPLTIVTLGFFLLVLNTLLILLASNIVPGFALDSFWWAFIFGIVLAIVNSVLDDVFAPKNTVE